MADQKSRDVKSIIPSPDIEIGVVVPEHVGSGDVSLSESSRGDAATISFSFD